jgi:hypothetical protein
MARQKVAVGDIGETLAVVGGLGILAYFLTTKLFGALTPPPTSGTTNNTANTGASASAAAADVAAAAAAGIRQTLSNNQIASMSTTISNYITNWSGDNDTLANIIETVDQINNQADWAALVAAFGVQKFNSSLSIWSVCNTVGYDCSSMNLPSALTLVLQGTPYQGTLNQFFTAQGINAQI